jgi:hypothetical protein
MVKVGETQYCQVVAKRNCDFCGADAQGSTACERCGKDVCRRHQMSFRVTSNVEGGWVTKEVAERGCYFCPECVIILCREGERRAKSVMEAKE